MSKPFAISSLLMLTICAAQPALAVRIGDFNTYPETPPPAAKAPAAPVSAVSAPVLAPVIKPAENRTVTLQPGGTSRQMTKPVPASTSLSTSLPALPPAPPPVKDPLQQKDEELLRLFATPPVDLGLVFELASLRRQRAQQAYRQGDTATAFDLLGNALQLDPNQPEAWETLGDWSRELPAPDGDAMAHYAYNEVVQLLPDHPRAHLKLAAIVTGHGDYPRAIQHFEQALSSDRAALQWNHLALLNTLYLRNNSPVQGMNFLRTRFDASSDDRFLLAEAILMDALGQGEAAAQLARLVAESNTLPDVLRQYAAILGDKFASAGNQRLYGKTTAGDGWLVNTGVAQ